MISVIVNEVSVERVSFTCRGCGKTWSGDYDAQHVEDGYGPDRRYYFYDGLPRPDPSTPGAATCPHCGPSPVIVIVTITTRPASPIVSATGTGDRGTQPRAGKAAERARAPLLSGSGRGAA